ncbi:unnamed protein product, partial [Vitis vinifera]
MLLTRFPRDQLASCSFFIVHLLYQNSRSHHNIGLVALWFSNKRNLCTWNFSELRSYHSQKISEPRNRRLTSNSHFCNHSSRKVPVRFGHSPKVLSGETYSVLQSSGFQHWFKNWQEQRKHKLTASTFGGAVGFWPRRREILSCFLNFRSMCPFFNGDKSIASPWSRVPLYCIPQAQGLMEIMDRDWMDFYVWTLNGSSLFRLYRDVEYWDVLKIALSDFWFKHVQPARELCSEHVITNPLIELRSLKPEPRHELFDALVVS